MIGSNTNKCWPAWLVFAWLGATVAISLLIIAPSLLFLHANTIRRHGEVRIDNFLSLPFFSFDLFKSIGMTSEAAWIGSQVVFGVLVVLIVGLLIALPIWRRHGATNGGGCS